MVTLILFMQLPGYDNKYQDIASLFPLYPTPFSGAYHCFRQHCLQLAVLVVGNLLLLSELQFQRQATDSLWSKMKNTAEQFNSAYMSKMRSGDGQLPGYDNKYQDIASLFP
ncbi:hypothetical protein, partial [Serratia marcescens]|uniref:hypothetical protein n=1 Tax=Serratia marcescens TaxID=615 RepID=UPI001BCEEE0A